VILDNANILTMDEALPRISALAIAGGYVLGGVDSREDAIASHAHERVDLDGMTVVPGFVDAHVHTSGVAIDQSLVPLGEATNIDDVLSIVRATAGNAPDVSTDWCIGRGWRDELIARQQARPDTLHDAAGERPCVLIAQDGHSIWITEHALLELGISWSDLELPGGVVERTPDGSPTGIVREASAAFIRERIPFPAPTTSQLARIVRDAARLGVTCIHDLDGAAGLRTWRALDRERGLQVRVVQHLLATDLPHAAALGVDGGFGSDRLRIGGIKVFLDGTLGSGTAWMHARGDQPARGVALLDREQLEELARDAAAAGFPLLIHAIGDAACTTAVDALAATSEQWSRLHACPRIEHAQVMRIEDMRRCAELGIALSIQPSHLLTDRDLAERAWADRLDDAYAWQAMVEAGCRILLGSDAPVEPISPLGALTTATTRDGGAHGLSPSRGPWRVDQCLDPMDALRACTSWAADATGTASWVGRLTPGRVADLVVLSDDPMDVGWANVEVVATMVHGRWTYGAANLAPARTRI
jgi:predicted amidohydrolase YtcJ